MKDFINITIKVAIILTGLFFSVFLSGALLKTVFNISNIMRCWISIGFGIVYLIICFFLFCCLVDDTEES